MNDKPLTAGVIGLGVPGKLVAKGLIECDIVRLAGVADKDASVAHSVGSECHVSAYDDNRSLIVEQRPDVIFLSVPPMDRVDLVNLCASRGIHVWTDPPLGRNLAEAAAMIKQMDQAGLKLAVGLHRRFCPGYLQARRMLDKFGQVFLARAHYLFNWGGDLGWRGDKSSAGGGALLELGCHVIDMAVSMFGLPEDVYGVVAGGNRPDQTGQQEPQRVYDTDDTATAIMRCPGGCTASVVTSRSSGPVSESLTIHGRKGSISADPNTCLLRDPDGNILDRTEETMPLAEVYGQMVHAFASAIINNSKTYECSGWECMLPLAVIEAVYLSDRTSQPENPARLLKNLELEPQDCLCCTPPQDD